MTNYMMSEIFRAYLYVSLNCYLEFEIITFYILGWYILHTYIEFSFKVMVWNLKLLHTYRSSTVFLSTTNKHDQKYAIMYILYQLTF